MDPSEVPEVVAQRLPLYVRVLTQLLSEESRMVSSHQLGNRLQVTPAQIRKDLSYFGKFGKQGKGYDIHSLLQELRGILGLERKWTTCLVGVGRLGKAIINYPGFAPEGFTIVAVFDRDIKRVGNAIGNLKVQPMSELGQAVEDQGIDIGIVAVPAAKAQTVINTLIENGIRGILNYAPIAPSVPKDIVMRNIDPVLSLQSMTFYLQKQYRTHPQEIIP